MPRYSTAFGMDVHLRSTTVCALDAETGEAVARRFRGNPWGEVAEWMRQCSPSPVSVHNVSHITAEVTASAAPTP